MSGGWDGEERRSSARHPGSFDAVLVVAGADGPEVHTGRTVEVSEAGCAVRLANAPGSSRSGCVLVVHAPEGRVTVLTAPITSAAGSSELVGLRFVQPVRRDDAWERVVLGVAATSPSR